MTKTSSDIKTVFFARYEACEQLYVLQCLQSYLVRTKTFRPPCGVDTPNQLLISYHRPHHAVKSCSIADGSRLFLLVPELTLVFLKAILRELRQLLKQGKAACRSKRFFRWLTGQGHRLYENREVRYNNTSLPSLCYDFVLLFLI